MYHQLCTGYYHLNTTGVEHEVAHLYEHMLVMTAHRRLAAAGVGNLLAGWVAGETFPRMMFIDYTLYMAQAEQVLAAYMAGPNRIDWDLLDQELQRVQTEARSVITNQAIADPTSPDRARLTRALQKLDRRPFYRYDDAAQGTAGDEFTPTYHAHLAGSNHAATPLLPMRPARQRYRDVAVRFGARGLPLQEKLAFLRLKPLIGSWLDSQLEPHGASLRGSSTPFDHLSSALAAVAIYTLPRTGLRLASLQRHLARSLPALAQELTAHPSNLAAYRDCFAHDPEWRDAPKEYYRAAGLLATRQAIARALTPGNIHTLLGKLQLEVRPATQADWDYLD